MKLGRPVEIVRRRTYAELNELLQNGKAEVGLVCTGAFAAAQGDRGPQALVIPVIRGKPTNQSYMITRTDSGLRSFADLEGRVFLLITAWNAASLALRSFADLEGRVFAFSDPPSNTGYRYVAARLHDAGSSPDEYFARFLFTYSHDNAIAAVLDGIADAGSVDSLVWEELVRRNPPLENNLIIIERSEEFPINPVVAGPGSTRELRHSVAAVFLGMAGDPKGARILAELGTDPSSAHAPSPGGVEDHCRKLEGVPSTVEGGGSGTLVLWPAFFISATGAWSSRWALSIQSWS